MAALVPCGPAVCRRKSSGTDGISAQTRPVTCWFANQLDKDARTYQHVLMTVDPSTFEGFMVTFVQRAVVRLLADEDIPVPLGVHELGKRHPALAKIGMAAHLRDAVDLYLAQLVLNGNTLGEALLAEVSNTGNTKSDTKSKSHRVTWKDIGEALGVSAQAAHRKYTHLARLIELAYPDD